MKLGIWGNKECVQCGACCYEYHMHFGDLCNYQEVWNKKSYCKAHDKKPPVCKKFFCDDVMPIVKEELKKIAFELGTVPK